jgi:tRNA (guanine26-N2/guanine27-N2)-dimethyltransferase
MRVREGAVEVEAPEQSGEGFEGEVFFNPDQELNRDLTVAALRVASDRFDADSYLDATAATGIRGVRAAAGGYEATLADRDPEAVELCRGNLERNELYGEVYHRDANVLMHQRRFDVVDLDPFGTPIPFADAAFRSARKLLCVTATDTAPLCGAHFDSGVRSYSAVPRNTEYHAEMGVRILVSALARTGARYDVGVTPVLSHATRHYARTYLAIENGATPANDAIDELGYVHHCPECLYRDHEVGTIPRPPEGCPNCDGENVLTAGPLWIGALRDPEFVADVAGAVDDGMGTAGSAEDLCGTLREELDTPTHYDQHRLCKNWTRSAASMDEFLDRLQSAGYETSRTHYGGTTFKTDADVAAIREATTAGD